MLKLNALQEHISGESGLRTQGSVAAVRGPVVLARLPQAAIGDICTLRLRNGKSLPAQVISFQDDLIRLAPFDNLEGISPGTVVENSGGLLQIKISSSIAGTVVDALGSPLPWSKFIPFSPLTENEHQPTAKVEILASPPPPLERQMIDETLITGVKSIDGLCSIGYGQRVGLFAGAGVGKSTLLGMIARNAAVDISVIALVAERGREVNEFILESLGEEGLRKSVVVLSTSDESPARRYTAAHTATAIAEYFRNQGKKVLLLIDSLTRTARALREIGLAAGEVPVRQGYTPSVYSELPKLLERAGNNHSGSITAIYTVLTADEHETDPLGEEIKSLLDGHIVLTAQTAQQGIRPAIDLTASVSRLINKLQTPEQLQRIQLLIRVLARLKKDRDILLFGGTPDPELQAALDLEPELRSFLNQTPWERTSIESVRQQVTQLVTRFEQHLPAPNASQPV